MVATSQPVPCADPLDDGATIDLRPLQGTWTSAQYLRLTANATRLMEFTDGRLEVLPMPTDLQQAISLSLAFALHPLLRERGGIVLCAPLRLRVREGKFREPDLLALLDAQDPRRQDDYWRGADLVMEVVSPDDPQRDTHDKRQDYAEAGIPEYWIVNPLDGTISVLSLSGDAYANERVHRRGERADSPLLRGFSVDVAETFDGA